MKRILFSFFILLSALSTVCYGQEESLQKANELYESLAYAEAVPIYVYFYEKGDLSVVPNLADCYDKLDDLFNAVDLYNQLVNSEYVEPKHQLRYGMLLMEFQQYAEAKNWLTKYAASNPGDARAQNLIEACNKIYSDFPNNDAVEIERLPMPVNSNKSEMGTAAFKNGFIFSSDRDSLVVNNRSKGTNRQFYDLYFASKSKGKWLTPTKIKGANTVTRFHEGPIALFNNESEMYFTRNNYEEERFSIFGKRGYDKNGVTRLKIYHARLKSGKWVTIDKLPFNNNEYSVAHPATNNAGNVVYFSSDKEGGFGGLDLYKIEFDGSNWSEPANMGPKVNTEGNEVFPYYHNEEDRLYFSSDGHVGIGGADVFMIENEEVVHLGRPINSAGDDFGISFSADKSFGYFTSNRSQRTNGDDDVYYFTNTNTIEVKPAIVATVQPKKVEVKKEVEPVKTPVVVEAPPTACKISGVLVDANKQPATNGFVSLLPDGNGKIDWKEVDESGNFQFETWSNLTYTLSGGRSKFAMETTRIIENSCLDKEYEMTLLSANKKPEVIAMKVIEVPVVEKPVVKKPIVKTPVVKEKPKTKIIKPTVVAKAPVVKKPKLKPVLEKEVPKKPVVVAKVPVVKEPKVKKEVSKPVVVAEAPVVKKPKVEPVKVLKPAVSEVSICKLSVKVLDVEGDPAEKTFVTLLNDQTGKSNQVETGLNGYTLFEIASNATYRVSAGRNKYSAEVVEDISKACAVAGENNTVQLKLRSKNPKAPVVAKNEIVKKPATVSRPIAVAEPIAKKTIVNKKPIIAATNNKAKVEQQKDNSITVKNTSKPATESFVKKLYWPYNEYLLDDEAKLALNEVVDEMLFNPIAKLNLTAYTPSGQDEVVAKRRAGIIIQHLLEKGVSFERIERNLETSNVSFSNCGNDFECIEEQRKVSSRTEIQIK